jgi:hypothetical protein
MAPQITKKNMAAEERRKRAEEEGRRGKERREQAEVEGRRESRWTTFVEFVHHSHNLLWRPLRVETLYRSTKGTIPIPTWKYCLTRLRTVSGFASPTARDL